jgi:hypothetical protein
MREFLPKIVWKKFIGIQRLVNSPSYGIPASRFVTNKHPPCNITAQAVTGQIKA